MDNMFQFHSPTLKSTEAVEFQARSLAPGLGVDVTMWLTLAKFASEPVEAKHWNERLDEWARTFEEEPEDSGNLKKNNH